MKEIPVGRGGLLSALVSDEDFALVSARKWYVLNTPRNVYARTWWFEAGGRRRFTLMHNLILDAKWVDHINHEGLDNRRGNLRLATSSQNNHNSRPQIGRKSAFKGVTWHARGRKWQARVACNGKVYYLGLFEDEVSAAIAYDTAARGLFGEFAYLNFGSAR